MEQDPTADTLRSIAPPRQRRPHSTTRQPTLRLANSEPSYPPADAQGCYNAYLSDSVPSLRFPRPEGKRQMTNWVSSQPDIMQLGDHLSEDELSLSELGYDVIGTDDESQGESTTSSFDFQQPDEVHSYAGTDVDTNDVDMDSSDDENDDDDDDDENEAMNDTAISDATFIEGSHGEDLSGSQQAGVTEAHSVENPLTLSLSGFIPLPSPAYPSLHRVHEPSAEVEHIEDGDIVDANVDADGMFLGAPASSGPSKPSESRWPRPLLQYETARVALNYAYQNRILVGFLVYLIVHGLAVLVLPPGMFFSSPIPKELSTVPVASVASLAQPSSVTEAVSLVTSSSASLQTPKALQTVTSSTALVSIPFGHENSDLVVTTDSDHICAAELFSRNEILVKIPQNLKTTWLAKDAIMIAVSRDLKDIPTTVSSVDDGFLIEVPMTEAQGVLSVSVATTRKPRINECFRISFGTHRLTEALDAGKQLVRGFAQKLAETVNDTTAWVEETYSIPALDMSKQVCEQTVSVSGSVRQSLQELQGQMMLLLGRNMPTRDQIVGSAQNFAEDRRDDLEMALLKGRLTSKLLWLKAQGKREEYQQYLSNAEAYWFKQRAEKDAARTLRAEQTKKQGQASRDETPALSETMSFFFRRPRGRA